MTLRYITLGLAAVGLVLPIISVVDTYITRKVNMLNHRALAVLGASIFKDRGECKVEGDGMVIFIKEDNGKVKVAIGLKRGANEVHQ